jgi:hypothetical protein
MATFPTAIPSYTNPTSTDYLSSPAHATQHSGANDEIVALATKVGITSSTDTNSLDFKVSYLKNLPEGTLINGRISPTVSSNNLTVAIKGMDGNDPSATNPVYVRIGNTVRTITAALSSSSNAGTNWANLGSAELATKETDLFVYLAHCAVDNTVRLGYSRLPYVRIYSDITNSDTNEKQMLGMNMGSISSATDTFVVVGRFAATLSAGAGYTWSVPTFTGANLIQRPIYETRWMDWVPNVNNATGLSYSAQNGSFLIGNGIINVIFFLTLSQTGTSNYVNINLPFATSSSFEIDNAARLYMSAGGGGSRIAYINSGEKTITIMDSSATGPTAWANSTYAISMQLIYPI